jgi:peptide/nickel transport system permease protein
MGTYITRRLIQSVIVILIVTIFVFFGMRMLPGDPIYMLFNPDQLKTFSPEEIEALRTEAGLNKPLITQYFDWLGNVFKGNLGSSVLTKRPISIELKKRIPVTAYLGIWSFLVSIFIGIPFGVISAIRRGSWLDTLVTTIANLGITVPIFWLGIMLMWLFAVHWHILPVMGFTSPFTNFWMSTKQLVMPVFCMCIFAVAGNARLSRSSMLEVLQQDYIRTAWSKGLTERAVIFKHAMKNSLIPIVTMVGMGISGIIGGSVLIEQVFNIPGMGRLAVDSLFQHDYPYVQGITLLTTSVIVLANLLVDVSYGWLDPRIRYN